jgi:sodium transport system permease protein
MRKIWIIFRKEVVDSVRDKRSWATGLFWALFGPILMGGMMLLLGFSMRDEIEKPMTLPVQNPEYAPGLVQFLGQHEMIVVPAPADSQAAVKAGDLSVVLVIPREYPGDFSSSRTATLQLVMDSSRTMQQLDVLRIRNLLEQYSAYMGRLRLVTRGVSPEVIRAVAVEQVDVATAQGAAMLLISYLPYFLIFAIFNGAAPIVIDTTAGERERQSLEPLLINPVRRRTFVLGKLFAAFPFSIADLLITLIGFAILFNLMPIEEILGARVDLNGSILVAIFFITLPIVFLAGAMQMLVASFVRSTKEASTYLPYIAIIPSLAGLAMAFFPVKPALWTMLIPTFGQQILIYQLIRQEPVRTADAGIATAATILVSAGFTLLAVWLYNREQIVIRKG